MCSVLAVPHFNIITADNVDSLLPSTYDTKEGTVVTLTCYTGGYKIKGPSEVTCKNGQWLPRIPVCVSGSSDTVTSAVVPASSATREDNSVVLMTIAALCAFTCAVLMITVVLKLCSQNTKKYDENTDFECSVSVTSSMLFKYPHYGAPLINLKWWRENKSWTYSSTDQLIRDIQRSRLENPDHSWRDFVSMSSRD
ncbi:hypothetical protein Btru_077445 [Bulinus truncatus]|nr:hypothetical protein Btru_077445 [Bulinus truncatus]